jgi:hypothetical protein
MHAVWAWRSNSEKYAWRITVGKRFFQLLKEQCSAQLRI